MSQLLWPPTRSARPAQTSGGLPARTQHLGKGAHGRPRLPPRSDWDREPSRQPAPSDPRDGPPGRPARSPLPGAAAPGGGEPPGRRAARRGQHSRPLAPRLLALGSRGVRPGPEAGVQSPLLPPDIAFSPCPTTHLLRSGSSLRDSARRAPRRGLGSGVQGSVGELRPDRALRPARRAQGPSSLRWPFALRSVPAAAAAATASPVRSLPPDWPARAAGPQSMPSPRPGPPAPAPRGSAPPGVRGGREGGRGGRVGPAEGSPGTEARDRTAPRGGAGVRPLC